MSTANHTVRCVILAGVMLSVFAAPASAEPRAQMKLNYNVPLAAKQSQVVANLKSFTVTNLSIADDAKKKNGLGPSNSTIPLQTLLPVHGLEFFDLYSLQDLANLSLEVYPDANPASGIYYYKPSHYFLHWDPDEGYHLTVDYKMKQDSGKNVLLDARLTPGAVRNDLQFIKELLKVYLAKLPSGSRPHNASQIQFLPLPAQYQAHFNLAALDVQESDMSVSGVDRDTGQIGLTLTADIGTREILIKKLGDNLGLQGTVHIEPQQVTSGQPAVAPFDVTATMKLADTQAYADTRWRRSTGATSNFTNRHPFPVRLKYLAYLYRTKNDELRLAGYDLGQQVLNPNDVATIPNNRITRQIDDADHVVRAWYVYSLVNEPVYRDRIVAELTGGVGSVPEHKVSIEMVQGQALFQQYSLYKVSVTVRSPYFDPDQRSVVEHSYSLTAENVQEEIAPLYSAEGDPGPLYEYQISLVTNDGVTHKDVAWRQPGGAFVDSIFIGSTQVEEVLGQ